MAFLGYEDPKAPGGLRPVGTGFLLNYQRFGYLITARHVARQLGEFPFCLRINRPDGGAIFELRDEARWVYPQDSTIDLAAIEFNPSGGDRLQKRFISDELLLTQERLEKCDIRSGCICYVVGLFKFLQGAEKNLPLVYTGNIARMELSERIPVYDKPTQKVEHCEVFLIEAHGIGGLSGAPVFARQTRSLTYQKRDGTVETVLVPSNNLDLLGLYQGAWYLPPDPALAAAYDTRRDDVVPVGLGMVVPASHIANLLETPSVKNAREAITKAHLPRTPTSEGSKPAAGKHDPLC